MAIRAGQPQLIGTVNPGSELVELPIARKGRIMDVARVKQLTRFNTRIIALDGGVTIY